MTQEVVKTRRMQQRARRIQKEQGIKYTQALRIAMAEPQINDRVKVVNSLLYKDEEGILQPNSGEPDDIWDFTVRLDTGKIIGVMRDDVEKVS